MLFFRLRISIPTRPVAFGVAQSGARPRARQASTLSSQAPRACSCWATTNIITIWTGLSPPRARSLARRGGGTREQFGICQHLRVRPGPQSTSRPGSRGCFANTGRFVRVWRPWWGFPNGARSLWHFIVPHSSDQVVRFRVIELDTEANYDLSALTSNECFLGRGRVGGAHPQRVRDDSQPATTPNNPRSHESTGTSHFEHWRSSDLAPFVCGRGPKLNAFELDFHNVAYACGLTQIPCQIPMISV